MKRHFNAAPWPTSLKLVSLCGTILLSAVAYVAFRVVPTPSGFTHNFGIGVALIPVVILIGSVFFIVRGYTVAPTELSVEHLITSTRVPLSGLTRVWIDSNICKGSIRVAGNGGLFSFTGWFYNQQLGRYLLLATALQNVVILKFRDRTLVVSPAAPQEFIHHLQCVIPGLRVGSEKHD